MLDLFANFIGVEKGPAAAPFFILISGIIGGSVAIWAVLTNRKIAKKKNSLDFIREHTNNRELWKSVTKIKTLHANQTESYMETMACAGNRDHEDSQTIKNTLNTYEALAACIHDGIYCDKSIKSVLYTTLDELYIHTKPYIKKRQELGKPTYFQEFEKMITRWKKNPLKIHQK